MKQTTYEIITYAEYGKRFPSSVNIWGLWMKSLIYVYDGDVCITADLDLDEHEGEAIFVNGNLTVEGNIANYEGDYGVALVVTGTTQARNIFAGGSCIYLNETYVQELCVGYYNHGELYIKKFKKWLFISSDHHSVVDLRDEAIGFSDDGLKGTFPLEDLYEIFKDQEWFEIENEEDEEEIEIYFDEYTFFEALENNSLKSEEIHERITKFRVKQQTALNNFEDFDVAIFRDIKDSLNKKVLNMRSSGYDAGSLREDMQIKLSDTVKIIHGDYHVKGDLCLDAKGKEEKVLLVDGDLLVDGTMFHTVWRSSLKICVLGKLVCKNFIMSVSNIIVKKDIQVKELLLYYNGTDIDDEYWELAVGPGRQITSKAAIFYNDVSMWSDINKNTKHIYSNFLDIVRSDSLDFEDLVPILETGFMSKNKEEYLLNIEKIIDHVRENKTIFKEGTLDNEVSDTFI